MNANDAFITWRSEEAVNWNSTVRLVEYIERVNQTILLPYTLGKSSRLKREVYFNPSWIEMLQDNNDELWNLMPMDSSLNSSKSNNLPKWDPFFRTFAENQFQMYELMQHSDRIRKLYEGCYRDNLHSLWAGQELYRPGNRKEEFIHILEKNMMPVYDSARRQGYEVWNYI